MSTTTQVPAKVPDDCGAFPPDPQHRYVIEDDWGNTRLFETREGAPGAAEMFVEQVMGMRCGIPLLGKHFFNPAPHIVYGVGPVVFVLWRHSDFTRVLRREVNHA